MEFYNISNEEVHGSGIEIINRLKNIIFNTTSVQTNDALKNYGTYYIENAVIYRTPIQSALKAVLNGLTFGQFAKNVKEHYDDIYHLYCIFHLSKAGSPDVYLLTEKTPNIVWEKRMGLASGQSNTTPFGVSFFRMENKVLFSEMIMRSMNRDGDDFHKYTPDEFNCQHYILSLFKSIYQPNTVPKDIYNFIYQDPQLLFKDTGVASKVANAVTALGHIVGRIAGKGEY